MKTFFKSILGVTAVFGGAALLSSCNDYLDITPLSDVSPEVYFTTAEQLGAYTMNYYAQGGTNGMRGSNAFPHYGYSGSGYQFYLDGDEGTDNECGTSPSGSFYFGDDCIRVGSGEGGSWGFGYIRAMNYFLNTVKPKVAAGKVTGSKELINHYIGEAYLLRAIEYYKKLRSVGDYPIIDGVLDLDRDSLVYYSRRFPRNVVARHIVADLDSAIAYLSDGTITGGKNRATRDIAYMEKARICLYEATFEKYFAGTPFVPDKNAGWPGAQKDYNKDFTYDNSTEVNFFLDQALAASKFIAEKYPTLTSNNKKTMGADITFASNPYFDMFTSDDLTAYENEVLMWRKYTIDVSGGHSMGQYRRGRVGFTQEFANAFLMENGLPIYDDNSQYAGDDYVVDTKKNRDYRWQLFMKAPNEYVYRQNDVQKVGIAKTRRSTDFLAPGIVSATYVGATTGYVKGKAFTPNLAYASGGQDITAPAIYRSAEAFLIYIEACWEKKGDALDDLAWTLWGKLRVRAGLPEDPMVTINATDLDKEEYYTHDLGLYSGGKRITSKVLYNIRRERRCELMSEAFRWDDLMRWRACDQLKETPLYLHGCKIFGPMKKDFPTGSNPGVLKYDQAKIDDNNVSSPSDVEGGFNGDPNYFSLFRINTNNKYYSTGMTWRLAHYLDPISYGNFLVSSPDGATAEDSPIYQNPYWPLEPNAQAIQ